MRNIWLVFVLLVISGFSVIADDNLEINLNCQYNRDESRNIRTCNGFFDDDVDKRNLTVTSLNNRYMKILVIGYGSYIDSKEIKALKFVNGEINFLPKGIDSYFPDLEILEIVNSELKEITNSDLAPFKNLKELHLQNNDLEFLTDDLFENNLQLEKIYFSGNGKLVHIGGNILKPLKNLEKAEFKNCGCIDVGHESASVGEVQSMLQKNCSNLVFMKEKEFGEISKKLRDEIEDLKKKVETLENENSELKLKAKSLIACDGNLDAATKNLHLALKKIEKYEKPIKLEDKDLKKVDIYCHEAEYRTCRVSDSFKVASPDTRIYVFSESGLFREGWNTYVIDNAQVLFLPQSFSGRLSRVKELRITYSGLFVINAESFPWMEKLEILNLTHNKIIEIPSNTFSQLKNLTKLDLSFNNIEEFHDESFSNLSKLEFLNITNNQIVSLDEKLFKPLLNLKELSLEHNKIKVVHPSTLVPLKKLTSLGFSNNICSKKWKPANSVAEIKEKVLEDCGARVECACGFKIDRSKPESLSACIFRDLVTEVILTKISDIKYDRDRDVDYPLKTLIIKDQLTPFLPYNIGNYFGLVKLVVENSKLSSLHRDVFKNLEKLKNIEIRSNDLAFIEEQAFDEVKQIESLDLTKNNIQSLPPKLFQNLAELKTLILSNNRIRKISADFLPVRNAIENLKIDNNELKVIDAAFLEPLNSVEVLDLSQNFCVDSVFIKKYQKITTLDEISKEIQINCASHLEDIFEAVQNLSKIVG